ncbi:dTDP-4-dehydrorhamnose reductase [Flavobacterium sp. F-380]|uniref:dTDP-4-dehydrorhamnose reductase n=1 Tax=Flavobacterium kayseriense TaxID=2764714 RepID=A0ABR7J7G9_9FLAO|nr:dTDP-4-dehydrorhamnose reductase [Flavobacterium kayseriense]MBC5841452.1 dTDP-4-dehydrorhamnose reductase [Flavobacterium kayseriense]MBC5847980.1 dTDP-4-dehydrorhamnose reductase [Flavobacterium kayseriense]
MKKIVVSGANGQLGSELRELSVSYPNYEWFFADRTQLSLDNLVGLEAQLQLLKPDILFNCAAYTAVDKAEKEQDLANTINHLAVAALAKYAHANDVLFIHVSTDYVFDGSQDKPLLEDEPTAPINVYGHTKLAGEKAAMYHNPDTIIIRTSWVYSEFGNNFVKTMMRLMAEREEISVVDDQFGSPTYAADLADVMMKIVEFPSWKPGIYHYSNEGRVSWFEFAKAIQLIGGFECQINGIATLNYPTPAARPSFSLLNKSKIKSTFNIEIPNYVTSLQKCMSKLRSR